MNPHAPAHTAATNRPHGVPPSGGGTIPSDRRRLGGSHRPNGKGVGIAPGLENSRDDGPKFRARTNPSIQPRREPPRRRRFANRIVTPSSGGTCASPRRWNFPAPPRHKNAPPAEAGSPRSPLAFPPSRRLAFALLLALTTLTARADNSWLDRLDDSLFLRSPNGFFRTDLSVLAALEFYSTDRRPPGLLFDNDPQSINPRLALFLDTRLGEHFYSLVQFRVDRGFDPLAKPDGTARFDEYLLRYTPFTAPTLNLQIGKFATVFGAWVHRHDSWNNPFINAPLPYENVFTITDKTVPASPAAFLKRRNSPDKKADWLTSIWGPSYTSGASVFGQLEKFDYALEVKNASLSSRPTVWDATDRTWSDPTITGRLGYRPNAAWNLGASTSHGGYLLDSATGLAGRRTSDFPQSTVGTDLSFAWHHWQFWGEAIATRFAVPNVGNAENLSYFLEAKYKLTTSLFTAVRWNQQFFDKIPDGAGGEQRWDQNAWRIDAALGWRFDRHLQTKLQYSYNHQRGPFQQGEQLLAAQVVVKF